MEIEIEHGTESLQIQSNENELILTRLSLTTLAADTIKQHKNAEYVDASYNRLKDLGWIYEFENIQYLILDSNRLCETHFQRLKLPLEKLKILTLNKNDFRDLHNTVAVLSHLFPNLEYLSLHGNPICPDNLVLMPWSDYISYEYDYYRSYIASFFPKLKFLDHYDLRHVFTGSLPQANIDTVSLTPKLLWLKLKDVFLSSPKAYTPLTRQAERPLGYHCGTIRKLSSKDKIYDGRDSEGNRFIRDSDL